MITVNEKHVFTLGMDIFIAMFTTQYMQIELSK